MSSPSEILSQHVLNSLPNGLEERWKLLDATLKCGRLAPEDRESIASALQTLDTHIVTVREASPELPLFTDSRGSGRLSDQPIVRGSTRLGDRPVARGSARLSDKTLVK